MASNIPAITLWSGFAINLKDGFSSFSRKPQIVTCRGNTMWNSVCRQIQLCGGVRGPAYNWLSPHSTLGVDNRWCCRFHIASKWRPQLSYGLEFSLWVQLPTFLSGLRALSYFTLSFLMVGRWVGERGLHFQTFIFFLSFFLSLLSFCFLPQNVQRENPGSLISCLQWNWIKESYFDRRGIYRWYDSDWTHVSETLAQDRRSKLCAVNAMQKNRYTVL